MVLSLMGKFGKIFNHAMGCLFHSRMVLCIPCKHTEYSLCAIYLTFASDTALSTGKCSGLIPGPKEPKRDITPLLAPLVQELQNFFVGVECIFSLCRRPYLFTVQKKHHFVIENSPKYRHTCP